MAVAQVVEVPRFKFRARPGSLAQKRQARGDGRVGGEALNVDARCELFEAMTLDERRENRLESESMQRIVRLISHVGGRVTLRG